jgi:hypothetical protein
MAKKRRGHKRKSCTVPNCLLCKFLPAIEAALGKHSTYWVDIDTGELCIATGLRALPDLSLIEMSKEFGWALVRCECGLKGSARLDTLRNGQSESCPYCSAMLAQLKRN